MFSVSKFSIMYGSPLCTLCCQCLCIVHFRLLLPFSLTFIYIGITLMGGGKRSTSRKSPTCSKSLINFITKCCIKYCNFQTFHLRILRLNLIFLRIPNSICISIVLIYKTVLITLNVGITFNFWLLQIKGIKRGDFIMAGSLNLITILLCLRRYHPVTSEDFIIAV
jgi:hypothetical protein